MTVDQMNIGVSHSGRSTENYYPTLQFPSVLTSSSSLFWYYDLFRFTLTALNSVVFQQQQQ